MRMRRAHRQPPAGPGARLDAMPALEMAPVAMQSSRAQRMACGKVLCPAPSVRQARRTLAPTEPASPASLVCFVIDRMGLKIH